MKIKFKKLHPRAQKPFKANEGDAGFDLKCVSAEIKQQKSSIFLECGTGLSLEIPKGYVGLLFPRSSISHTKHSLRNSVGVIDSGYRGEIKLRFSPDDSPQSYMAGDKVGQLVLLRLPKVEFEESDSLASSQRSEKGFGSSGK